MHILVVNPGGGSTRVALFDGEVEVHRAEVPAGAAATPAEDLAARLEAVRAAMDGWDLARLHAVVGRGGPIRPVRAGTWRVDDRLVADVLAGRVLAEHPSNLGAPLAAALAAGSGCPAFVVDPVSVDELEPAARITGLPELPRRSLFHALNVRSVARRHADALGRPLAELVLVVAHLGSGVSVALVSQGRVVDVNNSADEGPFSARRAGGLPAMALLDLVEADPACIPAFKRRMMSEAGLVAHLGTADLAKAEQRAKEGDGQAALVLDALALQVAKAVGALAAEARGRVDGILITGGMARSDRLVGDIAARVAWIAPVAGYPGEAEMEALATAAARVLDGEEPALDWP
ncbi:MAG: butyrate kinase [Deltaproteobacteria bacterium]|nr:butyrate kinase [Deltaproteobacteria bacterium]